MDSEVVVLGAGTAGIAAALTLGRRARRVTVVDYPRTRQPLGEVLPPGGRFQLEALGLVPIPASDRHRASWTRRSAWGTAKLAVHDLTFHPGGCAWHLEREAFEADLSANCRRVDGVSFLATRSRPGVLRANDGWRVEVGGGGTVRARFLVDATGRSSVVARQLGRAPRRRDRLVALTRLVDLDDHAEQDLLVESRSVGWWYLSPLPARGAVAALLTRPELLPRGQASRSAFWDRELRDTVHIKPRIRLSAAAAIQTAPAAAEHLPEPYGKDWIAVGDAAAAFDPLSSMGLAHALETGRLAAFAVDAALAGEHRLLAAYGRAVQRRVDEHDRRRHSYYALEQRWPTAPFWAPFATAANDPTWRTAA